MTDFARIFPTGLSRRQQVTLDWFTAASAEFAAMRKLAMNFERFCSAPIRPDWIHGSQRRTHLARITSGHSPDG
jgi:hypothetical protein